MGVHVVISGQGCRELEAWGLPSWWAYLKAIVSFGWHVTRLDYALDDRAGILDMSEVVGAFSAGDYTSPSRTWNLLRSGTRPGIVDGETIYLGSAKSDTRIRIYDKAAEQSCEPGTHWIRVELQLRADRAHQAAVQYSEAGESAPGMMAGLLLRQLDFKASGQADTHKSRQVTAPWWARFVGTLEKVRLSMAPAQRSLESVQGWLNKQVAPSLALVLAAAGGELTGLVEMAREGRSRWTATHRNMLAWSAPAPVLPGAGAAAVRWY
jgi:phage replication initiation protein